MKDYPIEASIGTKMAGSIIKKYKNRMIENDTGVGRVVCIQCELYKLAGGED